MEDLFGPLTKQPDWNELNRAQSAFGKPGLLEVGVFRRLRRQTALLQRMALCSWVTIGCCGLSSMGKASCGTIGRVIRADLGMASALVAFSDRRNCSRGLSFSKPWLAAFEKFITFELQGISACLSANS